MATVKGLWKFNDTISMTCWAASADATKEYVNFTAYQNDDNIAYSYIGFNLQHYYSSSTGQLDNIQFLKTSTTADVSYWWTSKDDSENNQWTYEERRTVDFGTTEQTVSDDFYAWLIFNALQRSEGDDSGESSEGATHALYNGVRRPIIPTAVSEEYPYMYMLNADSCYAFSVKPYFYSTTTFPSCLKADGKGVKCDYDFESDTWVLQETLSTIYIRINSVHWANYDIPNGSATATDIYFYGSEPVIEDSSDVEEEPTSTATIVYNDNVIATISDGQTATLECAGKIMVGDIVIVYSDAESGGEELPILSTPTVSLDGSILTINDAEGNASTATIYVDGEAKQVIAMSNLISFTINGTSYQAEEGMTWGEWCESEYNTDGYKIERYYAGFIESSNGLYVVMGDSYYPCLTDIISNSAEYTLSDRSN